MAKQDAITRKTAPKFAHNASKFAEQVNDFFIEEGIGWQLVGGQIVTRGTEAFEALDQVKRHRRGLMARLEHRLIQFETDAKSSGAMPQEQGPGMVSAG